jgi:hypothetical protein
MKTPFRFAALAAMFVVSTTPVVAQIFSREITSAELTAAGGANSIATNGTLIAVGVPKDDTKAADAGAVYIFNKATGAQVRKIYAPAGEENADDAFGFSVAVGGNILAVGVPFEETLGLSNRGAVYLYNLSTGAMLQKITDILGQAGDEFGYSVAISGELLVIGAPDADSLVPPFPANSGGITIWNLRTNSPSEPIFATTPESGARFGESVAVDCSAAGGVIAVGAPLHNGAGTDRGAAYLIDASTFEALVPGGIAGAANNDQFGTSVAIGRNRLFIGAPGMSANAGSVTAIDLRTLAVTVHAFGSLGGEECGRALAAGGDLAVVGIPGGMGGAGRAQVFQMRDANPLARLTAPPPVPSQRFSNSVAIHGDTVLATASNRGSFYLFSPVRSPLPFNELAVKGGAAASAPDTTFSAFTQLAVSPGAGKNVMLASLAGAGAAGGKNVGIWDGQYFGGFLGFQLQSILRTGIPVPGGAKPIALSNPVANRETEMGFMATFTGGGITPLNDRLFAVFNGAVSFPFGEDAPVPSTPLRVLSFQPPRHSPLGNGFVAPSSFRIIPGVTAASDSGQVFFNSAGITGFRSEGSAAPGIAGVLLGQFQPRAAFASLNVSTFTTMLVDDPAVAGTAVTVANNAAIFTGQFGKMARKGEPAPDGAGAGFGTFSNFLAETTNQAHTFIRATIVPPAGQAGKTEGIWSNRTAALRRVLLKGESRDAFGFENITVKSVLRFASNRFSDVIAWVTLEGLGVTSANDGAILLCRNEGPEPDPTVEVLLREGFAAPGCGGARVAAIQTFDAAINNATTDSYVILASLVVESGGATALDNQVLLLGSTHLGTLDQPAVRQPMSIIRKGQRFERAGAETVKSISLPGFVADASGALDTGLAHVVGGLLWCRAVVTWNDGQVSLVDPSP